MRGFMRVFVVSLMAMMSACFSWSRQTYDAQGDEPPRVRHSSWQAGVLPGRSPVEAAQADAIGTGAKYGYGGGYYGGYGAPMGAFGAMPMQYSTFRPIGVPRNSVVRFENMMDDAVVRVRLNGVVIPGHLDRRVESFVANNHPTDVRAEFCAYDALGGFLGYWRKSWRTREGAGFELVRGLFEGSTCPF